MYFAHDPNQNFYYLGDEPPGPRTYQQFLVDRHPSVIGVDVETISLKERIAIGISIALTPTCCFYFPLFPTESPVVPWELLKDPNVTKVIHNAMFDLGCMTEYELDDTNIMDTAVMSRLQCNKFNSLIDLGWVHKMEVHETKDFLEEHKAKIMLEAPEEAVARHCMQHAGASLKLYYEFLPGTNLEYFNTEMKTIPIMLKMEARGILIDHRVRMGIELQLDDEVESLLAMCEEAEAFNPGSPQQVGYILAKRGAYSVFGKLPFTKNKYGRSTGKLSTAEEILEKMDDPLAQLILSYRRKAKLLSTYIKPWAEETRAYTRYHLDAITGRPSSTDRNMQNIPGKYAKDGNLNTFNCRGILLPDSSTWTDVDLEQVEPRALGYLSGDKEMAYIFSQPKYNPDGSRNEEADIHLQVAIFMGTERRVGKTVNLAMTYGATDQTIMETAKIRSIGRASQLRTMWGQKFPQAMDYIEATQEQALRTGKAKTVFGREMRLPTLEEESVDGIKRKAIDYPCQGTAADILKRGLIVCKDMDIALQIHDELLIDGIVLQDKFASLEHIAPFRTPVEVKYLERWE